MTNLFKNCYFQLITASFQSTRAVFVHTSGLILPSFDINNFRANRVFTYTATNKVVNWLGATYAIAENRLISFVRAIRKT